MKNGGFTLVEMSIVLVVIGLIIMAVIPALNSARMASQRSLTDSNLQALMRATAVYVQANGCLPCPAPASATGGGFGRVRGDDSASPAPCGACIVQEGIPPFSSLGIPAATAHDGWNRWITMRVDRALTNNFGVVPPTSPCTSADAPCPVGTSQKGMCKSGLSTTYRINVQTVNGSSQLAAVIFVSHGPNGFGAYQASAKSTAMNADDNHPSFPDGALCAASTEVCNADGLNHFQLASPSNDKTNPFDDILMYADRNNIVSMLGNGSCQTTW